MSRDDNVRTLDPNQHIITFGAITMSAFAEGTYVKITGSGDKFTKRKGADGTIDRKNNQARDYGIELTLMQTSVTNDLLSLALAADMLNNTGIAEFSIVDLQGTSTFFAAKAWIAKDPDDEGADTLGNRVWRFDTGVAVKHTGGNF